MIGKAAYVTVVSVPVAVAGIATLHPQLPIGPIVLALSLVPEFG